MEIVPKINFHTRMVKEQTHSLTYQDSQILPKRTNVVFKILFVRGGFIELL